MIIDELKYFLFHLNFSIPFQSSKNTIRNRAIFIIRIKDKQNNFSYGECSPLPGFSYESIEDVELQLQKLSALLKDFDLGNDLSIIENFSSKRNLFPSVKFGIEQCLLCLLLSRNKNILERKYGLTKKEIYVNAVFGIGGRLDIIAGIEKKMNQGYNTFKIKIGDEKFDNDYTLIESIRKYFGSDIVLRLDVNGKWSKHEAVEHIDKLSKFKIEYIEEPCDRLDHLIELSETSSIPVAVDESINTATDALNIIRSSKIEFVVLKPMIISSIFSTVKLIEEAEKTGKKIIISSSFESAVGKSALVFLAALTNHNYTHGLDTTNQFSKNICKDNFPVSSGKIFFDQSNYPPIFDLTLS